MSERIQMNFSGEILNAFDLLRKQQYGDRNAKISKDYIVTKIVREIYPIFDQIDWREVYKANISEINEKRERLQTAITLEKEDVEKLYEMQPKFSGIAGTKRVFKPFVIKMLLFATILKHDNQISNIKATSRNQSYEELDSISVDKDDSNVLNLVNKIIDIGIDSFVFKKEFDLSDYEKKQQLYQISRTYLEKNNQELNMNLRNQINSSIKKYSDYFNIEKYMPKRRKTLGTANIVYISKVLAGVLLTISEIEGYDLDKIMENINEDIKPSN